MPSGFLNRVCANRIPRKVGGIALVHMLSRQGRILGEMTVTKLAEERFYALSAAAAELRDRDWLSQSVRAGERVEIDNVTEQRGVLVLSGPRSREILAALTDASLGHGGVPVAHGPRDPCGRPRRARAPGELRRRARVGAASEDRLDGGAV